MFTISNYVFTKPSVAENTTLFENTSRVVKQKQNRDLKKTEFFVFFLMNH